MRESQQSADERRTAALHEQSRDPRLAVEYALALDFGGMGSQDRRDLRTGEHILEMWRIDPGGAQTIQRELERAFLRR